LLGLLDDLASLGWKSKLWILPNSKSDGKEAKCDGYLVHKKDFAAVVIH
jgi:hypothetical protein